MIGIIGAMDEEVEQIVAVMDIKKEETKACMTFKAGILAGKDVVIVRSGIGKINAIFISLVFLKGKQKLFRIYFKNKQS